ncbi:hypothetical protein [Polaribacter sp.]|uniref:hypothetical protein n=1 Tax=Polaribacter sp. TaxID=1920175 RepID=UPI003F6A35E5
MKKILFLAIILLCSSCSILFHNHFERKSANYELQDLWVTATLDYNDNVKYLVNTTQENYVANHTDFYNEYVLNFFRDEFKNKFYSKVNYKDSNGKIVIPFTLDYKLSQEYINNLKQITDLDYIVLTKILSANQINNSNDFQYNNLKYKSNVLAGSVVFFKIIDIINNRKVIELRCKSAVYDNPKFNFNTNSYEDDNKIALYTNEEQLIKKCFKIIFRRIK